MALIPAQTTTYVLSFVTSRQPVVDGLPVVSADSIAWPDDRPGDYEADYYWDEVNHQWASDISGGDGGADGEGGLGDFALCGGVGHGANQWIVAIGSDDADDTVVYFGKA